MKLIPENLLADFSANADASKNTSEVNAASSRQAEIMKYVNEIASVDKYGQIVYKDGTKGSSLKEMVEYLTAPAEGLTERPFDSDKFLRLLINVGAPAETVAQKFSQFFPDQDINIKENTILKSTKLKWKRY